MATEKDNIIQVIDDNGQECILYPATKGENLFGTIDASDMIKLKLKNGAEANAPVLETGELYIATDTRELIFGTSAGNKRLSSGNAASGMTVTMATCSTASNVTDKAAVTANGDFVPTDGAVVFVEFANSDSTNNPKTLNIDGTGEGAIMVDDIDPATDSLYRIQAFVCRKIKDDIDGDYIVYYTFNGMSYNWEYAMELFQSNGFMGMSEVTQRLNELSEAIENGGSGGGSGESITVDSSLSSTSTNPVQNKVIKSALDNKFDTPSSGAQTFLKNVSAYNDGSIKYFSYGGISVDEVVASSGQFGYISCDQFSGPAADYAICREWADGNPDGEDRVGRFVIQDGKKIRLANSGDTDIRRMGVVSGSPCIIENAAPTEWKNKYLKDIYGRVQMQTVHHDAETDADGNIIREAYDVEEPIINPEWDESQEYIPRMDRPEYDAVGVLGILVVDDDGTCKVGGFCMPNDDSIATAAENGFYVEERLDEGHIKIFVR